MKLVPVVIFFLPCTFYLPQFCNLLSYKDAYCLKPIDFCSVKSIVVLLRYFIDNQSITISKVLTYLVRLPYSFSVTACIKLHNYPLFKDAESQCMQYSVSLYCEEQVKFDQKIKPKVTIKQSFQEFSFGYDEVRF